MSKNKKQSLIVTARGTGAVICLVEREGDRERILLETSGFIGRNGLGKRREGDGRTPEGVYGFLSAFGIKEDPGTAFPYLRVDETYYLVDDLRSRCYNRIVSTRRVKKDWRTAEHLVERGRAYAYGLVTDYNRACLPGVGSGIFLHCEEGKPTEGCIAVPERDMREILCRIDTDCHLVCEDGYL